ncbi:MAG TPA: polysaccharide deacetylase, partial [bacterium]|nr:polysaccharide deacetylase [bacterium]
DSLIRQAGYTDPIYFRPPYCKKLLALPFYLWRTNRITITWNVEPESYPEINRNSENIVSHVLRHTQPGSIILLHPMYGLQSTRDALEPIIEGLLSQGFQFVTVQDLLQYSQR